MWEQVYTASEILFAKLNEELKKLQDWIALGTVDLDSFVDEKLEEVSDWELNFKYLKVQYACRQQYWCRNQQNLSRLNFLNSCDLPACSKRS